MISETLTIKKILAEYQRGLLLGLERCNNALGSPELWDLCERDINGVSSYYMALKNYRWWQKAFDKLESTTDKNKCFNEIMVGNNS